MPMVSRGYSLLMREGGGRLIRLDSWGVIGESEAESDIDAMRCLGKRLIEAADTLSAQLKEPSIADALPSLHPGK